MSSPARRRGEIPGHGTYARAHGTANRPPCRCARCTRERSRYDKVLRLDHERGHRRTTNAEPVRARLRELRAAGATWRQIEQATGIVYTRLTQLVTEDRPTVWTATARKVMAVRPEQIAVTPRHVPVLGSLRRVRALMALGHPAAHIAATAGLCPQAVSEILNQRFPTIPASHHTALVAAYNRLWSHLGSSARNLARARAEGWAGPLQWDDESLDDPDGFPDWTGHCGSADGWLLHLSNAEKPCPACASHAPELAGRAASTVIGEACPQALDAVFTAGRSREASKAIGIPQSHLYRAYNIAKKNLEEAA